MPGAAARRLAAVSSHLGPGPARAAEAAGAPPPMLRLSSGYDMPVLGLGTFKAPPGEVAAAVKAAVRSGYRLIDCAAAYGNEAEVGQALQELFAEGAVRREELFVVSKVFQTHHAWHGDESRVRESLAKTLADLRLSYLDLLLIHWPFAFEQKKLDFPLRLDDGTPNPKLVVEMEYHDTWRVFETFVRDGKVRSIGVSNFTCEQLEDLRASCRIPPAVNQVECHPYLQQRELQRYCTRAHIALMAYSPLGSATPKVPARHGTTLMGHPEVKAVAAEVGRSPAQVLIRWSVQRGWISIPKSQKPERVQQNGDVLSWGLTAEQMRRIDALDCDFRYFISYVKKPDNNREWHDGLVGHRKIS
eukprot:TRINITY_DN9141_c0_g1_i1.p2 TRINITY_DN9141_c0_g1~~TRINITY_DN9141_c0_g1_i1.p2  ORF type:complete len:387 (+),score=137.99 TRINITY_DN9141_c0_g1_i1:87-1163(+)